MVNSHILENTINANNDYHSQKVRQANALGMSSLALKGAGIIHGSPGTMSPTHKAYKQPPGGNSITESMSPQNRLVGSVDYA